MARDRLDDLADEISRLREWRHQDVTPAIVAARHWQEYFERALSSQEQRMTFLEERLSALAKADEIEAAVENAVQNAVKQTRRNDDEVRRHEREHLLAAVRLPWRIVLGAGALAVSASAVGTFVRTVFFGA